MQDARSITYLNLSLCVIFVFQMEVLMLCVCVCVCYLCVSDGGSHAVCVCYLCVSDGAKGSVCAAVDQLSVLLQRCSQWLLHLHRWVSSPVLSDLSLSRPPLSSSSLLLLWSRPSPLSLLAWCTVLSVVHHHSVTGGAWGVFLQGWPCSIGGLEFWAQNIEWNSNEELLVLWL